MTTSPGALGSTGLHSGSANAIHRTA